MDEYYVNQAGSGFTPYSGVRYQKGSGFFGRIISGGFFPLLKSVLPYLGKKALNAGANIAEDVIDGKSFKESALKNLKEYGKTIGRDAVVKIRQQGQGIRRRRKKIGRGVGKCKLAPAFAQAMKMAKRKKKKKGKRKVKKPKKVKKKRKGKRRARKESSYNAF